MQVTLLPSATPASGADAFQFLTSYLLNDTIAIDAGCVGFHRSPRDQERIRHLFLSHSHIDHVASLPILLENIYTGDNDCVTVHCSPAVRESLQRDIFNERIWPDFIRMSGSAAPFLKLVEFDDGKPIELEGLRITPVPVNHVVPTHGFIVEDSTSAVVIPTDTGPTEAIWQLANRTPNLKAVFLEATFPNALTWLADLAGHLTPAQFGVEASKVRVPAGFLVVHIKPRHREQVIIELGALGMKNLEIAEPGRVYRF